MSTWLQNSDFNSIDIDHLSDFYAFEKFINSFDTQKLDETMRNLEKSKEDYCPWGIGINMGTDHGVHICRENVVLATYSVTVQDIQTRKIMGFIPSTKDIGTYSSGLSLQEVKEVVSEYYTIHKNRLA